MACFASEHTPLKPAAYDRALHFGTWGDLDSDGVNTRHEVLEKLSITPVRFGKNHKVIQGKWFDPYTEQYFLTPKKIDVDHVVSLRWAYEHGAKNWTKRERYHFANDISNLLAVSRSANRSKSSLSPLYWLPPSRAYWCQFVLKYKRTVTKYRLVWDEEEGADFKKLISDICHEGVLPITN